MNKSLFCLSLASALILVVSCNDDVVLPDRKISKFASNVFEAIFIKSDEIIFPDEPFPKWSKKQMLDGLTTFTGEHSDEIAILILENGVENFGKFETNTQTFRPLLKPIIPDVRMSMNDKVSYVFLSNHMGFLVKLTPGLDIESVTFVSNSPAVN